MAIQLSDKAKALLLAPNLANFATVMPDGSPHVAPVWVDYDGTHVIVNTAEGRQKLKNVRRDPRVAMDVVDRNNPYEVVIIRGRVVDLTHDGAADHIDKMAKKYLGQDRYSYRAPGEQRVIIKIEPEKVRTSG